MTFDASAALRRLRVGDRVALQRRDDAVLTFELDETSAQFLLDTTVYVDRLRGALPLVIIQQMERRLSNHSTVALSELTHLLGRLDPAHPGSASRVSTLTALLTGIAGRRMTRPSVRASGEAGVLAGMLARLTGRPHGIPLLNDALLLLHAREEGRVLVTRNVADFDLLQQLVPDARVLFYRVAPEDQRGPAFPGRPAPP